MNPAPNPRLAKWLEFQYPHPPIDVRAMVVDVLGHFPEIEEIWLFGSRARGDHHPGSDFDIAIVAPNLSFNQWMQASADLEALLLPWKMDLVHWETLSSDNPLRNAILANRVQWA